MDIDNAHDTSRPMGRPKLDQTATTVRFSDELLARLDALVGTKRRAVFIREAVEARVNYIEQMQKRDGEKL